MNAIPRLPLLAALLAGAAPSWSMISFGVGPKGGVNFSNVVTKYSTDMTVGFNAGATAEFGVTKPWSVLVEPQYSMGGAEKTVSGVKTEWSLGYLEIPVLAKAKFGSMKAHAYAFAGPNFGFLLSDKMKISGMPTVLGVDMNGTHDMKDSANTFQLFGDIGVGGAYQVAQFVYLQADVRYSYGFLDVTKNSSSSNPSVNPDDIKLEVGLLFHLTE